jgi:hypothetical protein
LEGRHEVGEKARRATVLPDPAPPLMFGGENGDHLIFRWQKGGIDRAASLRSWAPLGQAVATLKAVVGFAPER